MASIKPSRLRRFQWCSCIDEDHRGQEQLRHSVPIRDNKPRAARVLRATEIQTGPKTYLESCNLSRLQTVEPDEVVVFTLAAIPQRLRRFQRCRGVDVGVIGT